MWTPCRLSLHLNTSNQHVFLSSLRDLFLQDEVVVFAQRRTGKSQKASEPGD